MARLVRGGADVVAGSRYCRGGRQEGGPLLKRTLSRLAGVSLHYLAGLPVRDSTNNFRADSRRVVQVTRDGLVTDEASLWARVRWARGSVRTSTDVDFAGR